MTIKEKKRTWSERDQEVLDGKLHEIKKRFGNEEDCTAYLYDWKRKRYQCSKCGHRDCDKHPTRPSLLCKGKGCKHQSSVREGTIFYNKRGPLVNWFRMVLLIVQTKRKIPVTILQKALNIKYYDTAWRMRKEIEDTLFYPFKDKNPLLLLANLVTGRNIVSQFFKQYGYPKLIRGKRKTKSLKESLESISRTIIKKEEAKRFTLKTVKRNPPWL